MTTEEFAVVPIEDLRECEHNPRANGHHVRVREAMGQALDRGLVGAPPPVRTPCPHSRVLRPCERPALSRVARLAPNLIAALIGFCAGADPSFEAYERDRRRR